MTLLLCPADCGVHMNRRHRLSDLRLHCGVATALIALAACSSPASAEAQTPQPPTQTPVAADTAAAGIDRSVAPRKAGQSAAAAADSTVARTYARHFRIGEDLAGRIVRAARAEGVELAVAFGLVRVESNFVEKAVGGNAIGLTQVLPGTAKSMQAGITRAELFDADTNLRLGFRYLRGMLKRYDGDVEEALFAYKYGPVNLSRLRKAGRDPGPYARMVLQHGDTTRVVGPGGKAFQRKARP